MTLCFATNNLHKLEEVRQIVGNDFRIVSLAEINCFEELPETRDTLEGNSLQKAEYVWERFHISCIADDTGLEVEALNGAPGVFSARYAGEQKSSDDNISLLLQNLEKETNRTARFRTVITLIGLGPEPLYFDGVINGTIIRERRGSAGFGYDPVFVPQGYKATFAEMPAAEKNSLSHRSIAVKKLGAYLRNQL